MPVECIFSFCGSYLFDAPRIQDDVLERMPQTLSVILIAVMIISDPKRFWKKFQPFLETENEQQSIHSAAEPSRPENKFTQDGGQDHQS